jgi:predicted Zn-ribbon and HTH transcriptional regulator
MRSVVEDLEHVQRSLRDERMAVDPAQCKGCGFAFAKRARFTAPSRCPVCKGESTSEPLIRIE